MLHRVRRPPQVPDVTAIVGQSGAPETDDIVKM